MRYDEYNQKRLDAGDEPVLPALGLHAWDDADPVVKDAWRKAYLAEQEAEK